MRLSVATFACVERVSDAAVFQGFTPHIVSTISEWSLALSFISFFLTYIRDFKVSVSRQTICTCRTCPTRVCLSAEDQPACRGAASEQPPVRVAPPPARFCPRDVAAARREHLSAGRRDSSRLTVKQRSHNRLKRSKSRVCFCHFNADIACFSSVSLTMNGKGFVFLFWKYAFLYHCKMS